MVGLAVIIGYYFSFSYLEESAEMRAARHGYPYGTARAIRMRAHAKAHAEAEAHYNAAYRPHSD